MISKERQIGEWAKELLADGVALSPQAHVDRLRTVIRYADWKYYVQDDPLLADKEYDTLFLKLKELEKTFPELVIPDSPTQRVASGISEKFPTVSHLVPMLSLENSYNASDLIDWDRRCRQLAGTDALEYTVEPKYDGAGISLIYENNLLSRGATRGDGVRGEEITPNVRQIKSLPLSAPVSDAGMEQLEIRGEVLISKEKFAAYNEARIAEGLPLLANPRNAASGTLRMLDPKEVARRNLMAILYHVSYIGMQAGRQLPQQLQTHYDLLEWLHQQGFPTPLRDMKRCRNIQEVIAYCATYEQKRDELPFEIDGMVVKVNALDIQEKLGQTSHHPRWAIAYKFKARQATSTLLRVEFQVGRTGSITPVAKIEPVALGGVTISSISLFNEDVIRDKDLRIGDRVLVERAGDVIPYIVKPLSEQRSGSEAPIVFPEVCPVCKEAISKPEGDAAWRCSNLSCPAQVVEHMIHFASKDAMDIRNLGVANITRFYELGWLHRIADIYRLDYEKIKTLPKMGARSVENLRLAIEQSKQQPLHRLIFGLGIRYVGATTAKTLAAAVSHLRELSGWAEETLCTLEDVGPKVAASVRLFFETPENLELLDDLEALGLNLRADQGGQAGAGGAWSGLTFLFTGTLAKLKRSEAEALVEEKGGKILSGVSSKLNYLVVGADAGSKLEKAKKLGSVKILSEEAFLNLADTEGAEI